MRGMLHVAVDLLQRDRAGRERLEHLDDALVDPGQPLAHRLARATAGRITPASTTNGPRGEGSTTA